MHLQTPDKNLPERVRRFFQGQLAWYEHVLEELADVENHLDRGELDTLEAQRSLYGRDIAQMEKQLHALYAEWKAAPKPPPAVLEEIRALARQSESMAVRVAQELDRASDVSRARADTVKVSLQNLRKSRKLFTGYRQDAFDPGFIDEQI